MLIDYHTHSYRCGHARGTMREFIERALAAGLDEIGLTDHLYLYFQSEEKRSRRWAMAEEEYPRHYAEMVALRAEFAGRIAVRVAVEADFIPGAERDLVRALAPYEFDYVLGGVHFLDDWMMDDADQSGRYREQPVVETYRRYYAALLHAVESGIFQVVAHFDLPKKFGHLPEQSVSADITEVLRAMAVRGVALEVSTAGLRKPVNEIYPSEQILREAVALEVPLVLSSDAHDPREVAYCCDASLSLLDRLGVTHIATFEKGVMRGVAVGERVAR